MDTDNKLTSQNRLVLDIIESIESGTVDNKIIDIIRRLQENGTFRASEAYKDAEVIIQRLAKLDRINVHQLLRPEQRASLFIYLDHLAGGSTIGET